MFAWPWFLFIAAVYPLWFLYLHNIGQVYARSAAISSVVALGLVTVAYWIGLRVTRSRWLAALAVAVIVAAFYSLRSAARMDRLARWRNRTATVGGFNGAVNDPPCGFQRADGPRVRLRHLENFAADATAIMTA